MQLQYIEDLQACMLSNDEGGLKAIAPEFSMSQAGSDHQRLIWVDGRQRAPKERRLLRHQIHGVLEPLW